MKKTLIIMPIMAAVIFLGGCGNKNEAPNANIENNPTVDNSAGAKKDNLIEKAAGGLKDLLAMGKTMVCTTNQDGVETKIYIQGQKYKSMTTSKEMNIVGIFDGDTFYSWNTLTKSGMKITKTCMEELGKNIPKGEGSDKSGFESIDKLIEERAKDNSCTVSVDAVDFSVPTDMNFADQCAMMQGLTKGMKDFKVPGKQ